MPSLAQNLGKGPLKNDPGLMGKISFGALLTATLYTVSAEVHIKNRKSV